MCSSLVLSAVLVALAPAPAKSVQPAKPAVAKKKAAVAAEKKLDLSPELRGALQRLGETPTLTRAERQKLVTMAKLLRKGNDKAALQQWEALIRAQVERDVAVDIPALLGFVLREAYIDTHEDLAQHAAKVAFFNEQKKRVREHIQQLRAKLSEAKAGGAEKIAMRKLELRPTYVPKKGPVARGPKVSLPASQWETYLAELEEALATAGDDAQLFQLQLQDALQKQQQTLQAMSNIAKQAHATAMSIIQNMK